MFSQNKVLHEFINQWGKQLNKQEFGSKGFQVTRKIFGPEQSKQLKKAKSKEGYEDKDLSTDNMLWDLKVGKFYLTCVATYENFLFQGQFLDIFRESNNVYMWSKTMNEPYRLSHTKALKVLGGEPKEITLPMLQHLQTNEEASLETHIKYLFWITDYYGGVKRGEIPDTRFVNRWKEYLAENLDRFKGAMEIKHGEKHKNVCKMRSEMTQKFMSLFPHLEPRETIKLWCSRLATQLILIHYGEYILAYVDKKNLSERYKRKAKDRHFIDPLTKNKYLPTRPADLSKDFKKRFGVTNEDIEKWKIEVREQKPYKRSHSKGGSKKYR